MPLPNPKNKEKYRSFMSRFLKDKQVKKEFPDIKQRFAVAVKTWNNNKQLKGGNK